jgi:LPXTG-site transpeptidase (sortase) family protein
VKRALKSRWGFRRRLIVVAGALVCGGVAGVACGSGGERANSGGTDSGQFEAAATLTASAGSGVSQTGNGQPSQTATPLPEAPTPTPTPTPPPPTPTATPAPSTSPIAAFYLASAGVDARWAVEARDTERKGGVLYLQDPRNPQAIAWYPNYSRPGQAGGNTLVAAHVDYYTGVATPFARLRNAKAGDALYVKLSDGTQYTYTVIGWNLVKTENLDMAIVVYPKLDDHTERVTLISCGGDFIRNPSGVGGEYASRVILTAERYVP